MNNEHCFLRYKVSCVISLRFSLLSQYTFTLHLGELPLPRGRYASIFCSEPHPLAYCPQSVGDSPRKISPGWYNSLFG